MLNLINSIVARAQANRQRIVLPEGTEERTLKAANQILTDEVADLILLGNPEEINAAAAKWGLGNINRATIIDPENHPKKEEYAQLLCELRKKKGMTIEEARKLVLDPLYLGCLIIKSGDADGQLAGARNTTGDVLRPALQIIKTSPGITCVSGAMLLLTHAPECGQNGLLVMGDVAVTPVPDASQLAQIAVCTARTAQAVAGIAEPKVAMLSFSTKGSAKHENVDKVVEALKLAKEMAPDLNIDGEMQADAALVPSVGASKAPGSPVAGEATPVPDASQLAQIAVCTARTAQAVAGIAEPKVAMLSFSTKGSAKHENVDKVVEALKLAKEMAPDLNIDGEMQADAALVPSVGASKAPGSPVAGEANVLIVPSLEVGNISYKLVQRLGHADAVGPILQGIARPVNDLSRGCSIEDVYRMIAITANQAIAAKNGK